MGQAEAAYSSQLSTLGPIGRLLAYRDCLGILVLRSLRVRYRRSVIGFGWSLLYPLLSMVVLTVVFARVFPSVEHYALYVVAGVMAWSFFSLSCLQSMDSLLGAAPVLRKVYVPSAVYPLAVVGANMANLLASLLVFPLLVVFLDAPVRPDPGLLVLALLSLAGFAAGTGLLLAAFNLFFNDVRYFFENFLLLWFYASPIVYPAEVVPGHLSGLLWFNPFYWFLELFRAGLYGGAHLRPGTVWVTTAVSMAVLAVGWWAFSRLERRFHLYL
ncbi:MAG: ABC transporter permease [Deltaproteobacteria bacterium]